MAITKSETVTKIMTDENGNVTEQTTIKETSFDKIQEPDYIKIYTNMWCEFKSVPMQYRNLFLSLALKMSYCNKNDLEHSQLVYTGKPFSDELMKECGWTSYDSLMKGLKALCKSGAIKKIARGVYQINPSYAGRGGWQYNAKTGNGGIKDLIATFDFKQGTCTTDIVWADNGMEDDLNSCYRQGLKVKARDNASITQITKEYTDEGKADTNSSNPVCETA